MADHLEEQTGTSFHEHANEVITKRSMESNKEFGFTMNDTVQEGPKDMGNDGLSNKMRPAGIQ